MTVQDLVHKLISAKARRAGLKVCRDVKLSLGGKYFVAKTAEVVLNDKVWLAQDHQIEALAGSKIIIGSNVHFGKRAIIIAGPGASITIAEGCFFNHDISITALSAIDIGRNSIFGPYTYISDHNHQFASGMLIKEQGYDTQSLSVGSDVWLGVGVTLIKGASVGDGSVIAARAVVNKQIPDDEIWGGIPAKKIGDRD